ncbi:hypothetical protein [Herbiconiux daphne]|uniref:DUF3558 domain-containing protein n=1 Tax=Herbiconiux daphne TaxID=2970914 RepID=A0ABT2GXQ6_9MICO|nr:hypothetical protein [Herbiconiux daphne]MCS5732744.1 hypothetical protein [Herbiconiux daphne]
MRASRATGIRAATGVAALCLVTLSSAGCAVSAGGSDSPASAAGAASDAGHDSGHDSSRGATAAPASPATGVPATDTAARSTTDAAPVIDLACDDPEVADVIMAVDSELFAEPQFAPDPGSFTQQIVSLGGMVCGWSDAGSGATLSFAVAQPSPDDLAAAQASVAAESTPVELGGQGPSVDAYAVVAGGAFAGDLEVFTAEGYWLSTVSPLYKTPESAEAADVLALLLQYLPSG